MKKRFVYSICVLITWLLTIAPASGSQPVDESPSLRAGTPLYRVTLWKEADPGQAVVLQGSLKGLDRSGSKRYAQGKVTVHRAAHASGQAWSIDVKPAPGFGVYKVEFPIIHVDAMTPGATGERLLVPYGDGAAIHDPYHKKDRISGQSPRMGRGVWHATYPSRMAEMQMLILDDGDDHGQGLMIWTPDGQMNIKDFTVGSVTPGKTLSLWVTHFPANTGQPGTGWTSPYPVVLTPFDRGWYAAAQVYRDWALQQIWCEQGTILERIERGDLPQWYRRQMVWTTAIDSSNYDRMIQTKDLLPGIDLGVFLTQWQRWPFDKKMPEYFPPKNQVGYRKMLALKRKGIHFFPYLNAQLVDMDYDTPINRKLIAQVASQGPPQSAGWFMTDYVEYWGQNKKATEHLKARFRQAWKGPLNQELIDGIRGPGFPDYPYSKNQLAQKLKDNWGKNPKVIETIRVKRRFKPMDISTSQWRDIVVGLVQKNVKTYGADAHYLDQLDRNNVYPCFSQTHGHAPGFGDYYAKGIHQLIAQIRKACSGIVLYSEGVSEPTLGMVEHYVRFPRYYDKRYTLVPLFASVYQGYTCFNTWDLYPPSLVRMEDYAAVVAMEVHLGRKIGNSPSVQTWIDLLKPNKKEFLDYFVKLSQLYLTISDMHVYGRRLQDPVVTGSPMQNVTWYHNKSGSKKSTHKIPVVQASCWESLKSPGKRLLLVSNTSAKKATVTIASDYFSDGEVMKEVNGQTWIYGSNAPIQIDPFSWKALVVTMSN